MIEVGTYEAKTNFSALLDRVERGEDVVITRHGRPVAAGQGQGRRGDCALEGGPQRALSRRPFVQGASG